MTEEQFHNETVYQIALYHLRILLSEGKITRKQFQEKNNDLINIYHPVYADFEEEEDNENHNADNSAGNQA